MKTNTFKYFGLALMAILMVSFTSCEVEIDSFYDAVSYTHLTLPTTPYV